MCLPVRLHQKALVQPYPSQIGTHLHLPLSSSLLQQPSSSLDPHEYEGDADPDLTDWNSLSCSLSPIPESDNDKAGPSTPTTSRESSFELANLIYCCNQTPATQIDHLLQIWAITLSEMESPPYADHNDLYATIDATTLGSVPWESFLVSYNNSWALLLNQLSNPDFAQEIDFAPKCVMDHYGKHRYQDFMSGNWAWQQADLIAEDPLMHDSMFCPAILGSDKTTVSVATGQNEYYLLYLSNRLIHNNLFHGSLNYILQLLYSNGHYRRTIFRLGPYIGDYPEQVLLACIIQRWCAKCTGHQNNLDGEATQHSHVHTMACFEAMSPKELWDNYGIVDGIIPFTHGFPCTDIHELLSPDLLHQVIKGTFKDHLVTWVKEYIVQENDKKDATQILADIDRRYTISGHVPSQMMHTVATFMEFCYLVQCSVLDEDDLVVLDNTIERYHREQEIFHDVGIQPDGFSLPWQHSINFGAPNGLCSSITESKHIKAIKKPWRCSSQFNTLPQMLQINERLDKLHAAHVNFQVCGMLNGSMFGTMDLDISTLPDEDDNGGEVDTFHGDILGEQIASRQDLDIDTDVSIHNCPKYHGKIYTYTSAIATYYTSSDLSGISGMHCEHIQSTHSWWNRPPHYDCMFAEADKDLASFWGLHVARILLFFSIQHEDILYPYALVTWFSEMDNQPCEEMGMWIVKPDLDHRGGRLMSVIHLDSILRRVHLIGVSGTSSLPVELKHIDSLDAFQYFYVNKYADHHSYKIAF
ncbi:hypothetical protein EV421DRAFT_1889156 [Armillaria borealis]|uniref:Uncharacterized protein n=1 Tax=Armillaria borealis TaxID=47425 RepID=A0AA39JV52_9AGAR|nr:hypothetical protein EV421DRAFT_1889156 [Armillaria borealis]